MRWSSQRWEFDGLKTEENVLQLQNFTEQALTPMENPTQRTLTPNQTRCV